MAFLEFALILSEPTNPTIVLTDKKSVTRFFQTKAVPPALWNAREYVLQFNIKIAHIAASVNNAADFLSRLELKVTEKIHIRIRQDIQTTPIEVITSSLDVADGESFFFTEADSKDKSEEQTVERKKQIRRNARQWEENEEPSSFRTSVKEFTKIDGDTTSFSLNGIEAKAGRQLLQDVDFVLIQIHDTNFTKQLKTAIFLKDGLLFRNYFGKTSSVKYYQILIPNHLVNKVLRSLQGEFGKHRGIAKTKIVHKEKNYFPKMAQLIREWVMSCEQCIRESRIDRSFAPALPCKTPMSTILRSKTPSNLI